MRSHFIQEIIEAKGFIVSSSCKTVPSMKEEWAAKQVSILFAERWDKQYPMISKFWMNRYQSIILFFAFSLKIRKAICTTSAIESLNI
ncbi:transposase [Altericista sp. CCNU0014]|uniref:transposase n=1 Tax=Altericista sp. CCNU0014 TaxID=3082949 RepID=UPI00384F9656